MQQIKGTCFFCKKPVMKHSLKEARTHLMMSHSCVIIQKRAKEIVTKDLRLLGKRLKSYLDKNQYQCLVRNLRYPL